MKAFCRVSLGASGVRGTGNWQSFSSRPHVYSDSCEIAVVQLKGRAAGAEAVPFSGPDTNECRRSSVSEPDLSQGKTLRLAIGRRIV